MIYNAEPIAKLDMTNPHLTFIMAFVKHQQLFSYHIQSVYVDRQLAIFTVTCQTNVKKQFSRGHPIKGINKK